MRTRWMLILATAMLAGAVGGTLLSPAPTGAVAREIIELQRDVASLIQGQRDLQRSLDEKHAIQKTLLEQSMDAVNKLNASIGSLQKTMQDVQANSGARLDSMTTQVQGLADNLEEVKARLGKANQQLAEVQNTLQSLDAKVAGGASAPGSSPGPTSPGTQPPGVPPPSGSGPPSGHSGSAPSADVLYSNGLRDITGGKYDLARQEFEDYLRYYPNTDLASNAQFYLGEIFFAQKQYKEAVAEYDKVLTNYPKSFKLAPARLKKGTALVELGQKPSAIREFREIVRRYPGTEEERRARAKLRELGATPTAQQ